MMKMEKDRANFQGKKRNPVQSLSELFCKSHSHVSGYQQGEHMNYPPVQDELDSLFLCTLNSLHQMLLVWR